MPAAAHRPACDVLVSALVIQAQRRREQAENPQEDAVIELSCIKRLGIDAFPAFAVAEPELAYAATPPLPYQRQAYMRLRRGVKHAVDPVGPPGERKQPRQRLLQIQPPAHRVRPVAGWL